MSQSGIANLALSGGGSGVGVIDKILGDTGSITGNTVTIYANNANIGFPGPAAGGTVFFANSGTVSTLNFGDASGNTYLGQGNGQNGQGSFNTCVGNSETYGGAPITATNCTIIGYHMGGGSLVDNNYTTSIGSGAGQFIAFQPGNINNTCIGALALSAMTPGSWNFVAGYRSAINYAALESNNIIIANNGLAGDNNTIRIGTQGTSGGQQNTCFIAGITGVTVSTPQQVTINPSTGQLGVSNASLGGWTDTSGTVNATSGSGYFITATSTSTLPASPTEGDTISYIVDTASILTITANTGQFIRLASAISASGGTCASTARGNSIRLVYRTVGTTWIASSSVGNWVIT